MNKLSVFITLGLVILFNSMINCQNISVSEQENIIIKSEIPDKKGMTVKGIVVDDNNDPISGVVVNDGKNFTVTGYDGFYYLPSDFNKNKYVQISIPADYEIEKDVAYSFYKKLSAKQVINRRDFKLKKRTSVLKKFTYIAVSDPQIRNESDVKRFEQETMIDLKESIRNNENREIYLMTLGDNVFDKMGLFPLYKTMLSSLKIPVFSTIGNHDIDLRYNDLHNTTGNNENYGEEIYESFFGPSDYSFNVGDVHIITMKNIDYFAGKKYTERLTSEQLEWLKNDLKYVENGTTVFLNVHAPTANKTSDGSGNTRNASELFEILKGYNVHIFAGHTHFFENSLPAPGIYEHNIGAACGAWWAGNFNRCGAPNGYLIVDIDGNNVKWHYKSTGKDLSYQFKIYKPGEFLSQSEYLVVNVWDWDTSYKVRWYENGVYKGELEQFEDEDQDFITMKDGVGTGYKTMHLFRLKSVKENKEIKIEIINRFGESYSQSVSL